MHQRIALKFFAAMLTTGALAGALSPRAAAATFYVDVNNTACSDAPTFGSESRPYCSLRYVASIAQPGDTFLFKNGRYGHGGTFTRSGTAAAPITYKAIGTDVSIGTFEDVRDEDFSATPYPHVYSVAWNKPCCTGYRITQTYFDPILVDDPVNASIFTMKQEDGPMMLSSVVDYTTLSAHEGTWFYQNGKLYVHPFSDRTPSTSGTDLVVGHVLDGSLRVESNVQYTVFDGFTLNYTGGTATPSFLVFGSFNKFLNLKFQTMPWSLRGTHNYAENISVSHVFLRDDQWTWDWQGEGTAMAVFGTGHVLKNLHIFHNWNSSINQESSTGVVIDGLRMHGAPNHCGSIGGRNDNILRNAVMYNCQDYFYLHETDNVLIEHTVNPSGISLQGLTRPVGKVTVRNSILNGTFGYTTKAKPEYCQWESGSLMENNVISTAATIERCADGKAYPILEYMAKCESGEFTGCMTIRNNKMVSDFKTVIKDGMWNAALGDTWDVHLVANSPAIDAGTISGAQTDFSGVARPQGSDFDAGIYETCAGACDPNPPQPSIPTLRLDLPAVLPLDAQINATYSGGAPPSYFVWDFTPITNTATAAPLAAPGMALNPKTAPAAHLNTSRPQADLSSVPLGLGPYLISVSVFDINNHAFGPAQAEVTLVSGDLAAARVFPNPWRSDLHSDRGITFENLAAGTTIKIFTVSGHWIKTLQSGAALTSWDLTNAKGQKVASGIYIYHLTTDSGQKKTGKLVIIR